MLPAERGHPQAVDQDNRVGPVGMDRVGAHVWVPLRAGACDVLRVQTGRKPCSEASPVGGGRRRSRGPPPPPAPPRTTTARPPQNGRVLLPPRQPPPAPPGHLDVEDTPPDPRPAQRALGRLF